MSAGGVERVRGLLVLSRDDCMRLLGLGGVGRIAVPSGRRAPTIRPVNFALQGERIVMRTSDRALWAAAAGRVAASFEFDEVRNEDHWTWNVIATGRLEELTVDAPVKPWAPSEDERSLALTISDVSGRQVPDLHAATPPPRPSPPADLSDRGRRIDVDDDGVDRWGRSERARTVLRTLAHPLYRFWFRFSLEHPERIPSHGGAMLVANHAGLVPVDAALLMHGVERELDRPVYGLHHHALAAVPALGVLLARAGGVVAHPENALRILRDERQLVLVFPEGTKGTSKLYRDRYRLARFGRGGFIATAMRAGVPVVPVAVVGSEETMPMLARLPGGLPLTLNGLLFGPYGSAVQLPSAITARVLEPVVFDEPPGMEQYPTDRVTEGAAEIRARIQAAVDEMVAARAPRRQP